VEDGEEVEGEENVDEPVPESLSFIMSEALLFQKMIIFSTAS
jgi:hypothetical protein